MKGILSMLAIVGFIIVEVIGSALLLVASALIAVGLAASAVAVCMMVFGACCINGDDFK